ncbi:MAG: hypothetical protein H0V88_09640 [Pyrinomonadaceae bacterium]|nr:hypothetical protein [Pyrinomonadaceae bacterium]
MKLFITLLITISLMLSGAAETPAQQIKPQRSTAGRARVRFDCSPRKLWRGDTLLLTMSVPHGRDLAVVSPDGKFFWLRSWEPENREVTAQWFAFENVRRLRLATNEVAGITNDNKGLIFTKTGWYRIRLSDNLETDDGTPVYECKVYYVHKFRP